VPPCLLDKLAKHHSMMNDCKKLRIAGYGAPITFYFINSSIMVSIELQSTQSFKSFKTHTHIQGFKIERAPKIDYIPDFFNV